MNDTIELLPCPFCRDIDIKFYRNGNSHYAYCSMCEASTKNFLVNTSNEIIIKFWNKRVK